MTLKLLHSVSIPASLFAFKSLGFITSYCIRYKLESDQRLSDHVVAIEVPVPLLRTYCILIVLGVCRTPADKDCLNLLKPTGYVMHQQFYIQQLYVLPTLYLSEYKQRLVPLTA